MLLHRCTFFIVNAHNIKYIILTLLSVQFNSIKYFMLLSNTGPFSPVVFVCLFSALKDVAQRAGYQVGQGEVPSHLSVSSLAGDTGPRVLLSKDSLCC